MSDLPFTWATTVGREHLDSFLLDSFKNHTSSNSDIQGHMEETMHAGLRARVSLGILFKLKGLYIQFKLMKCWSW